MGKRMQIIVGYDGTPSAEAVISDLSHVGLPADTDCIVMTLEGSWSAEERKGAERREATAFRESDGDAVAITERPAVDVERGGKSEHARSVAAEGVRRIQSLFPAWSVRSDVRSDGPVYGLLDGIMESRADLVIVGTHGRGAIGRLFLGSVSHALLRDAPCSVRIARAPTTSQAAALRIVAGLDGSHDADAVIAELALRHWPTGSAVHLVSAYSPLYEATYGNWGMPVLPIETVDDTMRLAFSQIERAHSLLAPTGLVVTHAVRRETPVSMILDEAERWGADAIFLGARGHRALDRILLGSVSISVANKAHCSVEVIRPWRRAGE